MRTTPMIIVAAAIVTASPAFAQNETANAPANAAATNATEMNATANIAANVPMPAEPVAVPGENVTNETTPAPAPAKRSFPWGLLGILGLLGLIPRTRR
jgi:hypothetical protein